MENTTYWIKIAEIVSIVLKAPLDDHDQLLDEHCGDQVNLRWDVERALSAHKEEGMTGLEHMMDQVGEDARQAANTPEPSKEGAQIGHFFIQKLLGKGAQGVVYEAWDSKLRRTVALKFIAGTKKEAPIRSSMLEQEAKNAADVKSPFICQVYSLHEDDENGPYFAMELVDGKPLNQIMRERTVEIEEAIEIFKQLCEALRVIHNKGYVHRDIKPSNVMWDEVHWKLKLMDFGIARLQRNLRGGEIAGTLPYMSPEQIRGDITNKKSDIWALGILMYELFSGVHPFRGQGTPSLEDLRGSIISDLPAPALAVPNSFSPVLKSLVARCLEKKPEKRFGSVLTIQQILKDRDNAPARRRSFAVLAGSLAVIVLVIVAFRFSDSVNLPNPFKPTTIGILVEDPLIPLSSRELAAQQYTTNAIEFTLNDLFSETSSKWHIVPYISSRGVSLEGARTELKLDYAYLVRTRLEQSQILVTINYFDVQNNRSLKQFNFRFEENESTESMLIRSISQTLDIDLTERDIFRLIYGKYDNSNAYGLFSSAMDRLENNYSLTDLRDAVTLLEQAIDQDSLLTPAYTNLARAYQYISYMTRDPEDFRKSVNAIQNLLDREAITSVESERISIRAYHKSAQGDFDGALADLSLAIALSPENTQLRVEQARVFEAMSNASEAERILREAIELDPEDWFIQDALGLFLYRQGRYDESEIVFQDLLVQAPRNIRVIKNLAAVYQLRGMYASAIPFLENANSIEADHSVLSNLAVAYWQTAQKERAVEYFLEALEVDSSDYRVWNNLASVYDELKDPKAAPIYIKALDMAEAFQQVSPFDDGLLHNLPWLYKDTNQPGKACQAIAIARDKDLWSRIPAYGSSLDSLHAIIPCSL